LTHLADTAVCHNTCRQCNHDKTKTVHNICTSKPKLALGLKPKPVRTNGIQP